MGGNFETREAIKKLQIDIDERIRQLEKDAPDWDPGNMKPITLDEYKEAEKNF